MYISNIWMLNLQELKAELLRLEKLVPLLEKFQKYTDNIKIIRPECLHLFLHSYSRDPEHVAMLEEIVKLGRSYNIDKVKQELCQTRFNYYNQLHETAMDMKTSETEKAQPTYAICADPVMDNF